MEKPLFVFREEAPKYNYDLLNRLLSVEIYEEGTSSASETVFYEYNPKGERVKRTGTDGSTTWYAYDGSGNVVYQEFEGDDRYEEIIYLRGKRFAFNRGKLSAREAGDNTTERFFYITDHLGSVVKITDREGKEVWSNDYKPFGGETGNSGIIEHGAIYTGKDVDPETGLHYFNARWYDSDLGRFVTEDPIKDGNNWYVYVGNNPLIYIDPTGLFRKSTYRPPSNEIISPGSGGGRIITNTPMRAASVKNIPKGAVDVTGYYWKTSPAASSAPSVSRLPSMTPNPGITRVMAGDIGMMSGSGLGPVYGPQPNPETYEFPGAQNNSGEIMEPGGDPAPVEMPGAGNGTPVVMPAQNPMGHAGFPANDALLPGANSNVGETIGDPQVSQEVLLFGGGQPGTYSPDRPLPRDKHGNPIPDTSAPHTQLGRKKGRKGTYTQGREFDENGTPVRDIDFTDHSRPQNHPNPHVHEYIPNETGGTSKRSKTGKPLNSEEIK